jgi:putative CRISPR-associated protein (TIGR02620 family)
MDHLDATALQTLWPGERVLGTLSVHLAAKVCLRCARYRLFNRKMSIEIDDFGG